METYLGVFCFPSISFAKDLTRSVGISTWLITHRLTIQSSSLDLLPHGSWAFAAVINDRLSIGPQVDLVYASEIAYFLKVVWELKPAS